MRRKAIPSAIFALVLSSTSAGAPSSARADLALDVSPVRIEISTEPGAECTDAVTVQNTATEAVRLRCYVEDWTMTEDGTPVFRPAGALPRSASPWIDWGPSDVLLEPGESKLVRITARVPHLLAEGGYHTSLLLESIPIRPAERGSRQMFVRGRVACMIYVRVGHPRRSAEIVSLSASARDERRYLRVEVANTGEDFVRLSGSAALLTADGRDGGGCDLPDVPILPGKRRWVEIEVPRSGSMDITLARVTIDIPDVGILVGECPLTAEGGVASR